ncbi:MAG TPA: hypothetical protein VK205_00640, partial [Prolixibacteraceae bacterium]|nr:hypothetical protein [Prolixibacteraceae bacterium]
MDHLRGLSRFIDIVFIAATATGSHRTRYCSFKPTNPFNPKWGLLISKSTLQVAHSKQSLWITFEVYPGFLLLSSLLPLRLEVTVPRYCSFNIFNPFYFNHFNHLTF